MRIVAVDPGKSGGIAIRDATGVTVAKMPETPKDLWLLLAECEPATAFIEKVGATPQMGTVSAFTFGYGTGLIEMACLAAGLRIERVTPAKWQRAVGIPSSKKKLGEGDSAKKNLNKARAQELFPAVKVTHAIADALLISEYGWRLQNLNESEADDAQANN